MSLLNYTLRFVLLHFPTYARFIIKSPIPFTSVMILFVSNIHMYLSLFIQPVYTTNYISYIYIYIYIYIEDRKCNSLIMTQWIKKLFWIFHNISSQPYLCYKVIYLLTCTYYCRSPFCSIQLMYCLTDMNQQSPTIAVEAMDLKAIIVSWLSYHEQHNKARTKRPSPCRR